MNLHDLVEVAPNTFSAQVDEKPYVKAAATMIKEMEAFCKLAETYIPNSETRREITSKAMNVAVEQYNAHRQRSFEELDLRLPESLLKGRESNRGYALIESNDWLSKAARTPRASMETLRRLCDELSLVIMPFEYHNPKSYQGEDWRITSAIDSFTTLGKEGFDVHVLSPIQHYDIERHVKAVNPNKPLYSQFHEQTLLTVALQIPMFQSILNTLSDLKTKVDGIGQKLNSVQQNVASLQIQFDRLAQKVAELQEARLLARLREVEAEKQIAAERKLEMLFSVCDPMAIAIPKESNIATYKGSALVGPCWGPEFTSLYAAQFPIVSKRTEISKTISSIYGGYR